MTIADANIAIAEADGWEQCYISSSGFPCGKLTIKGGERWPERLPTYTGPSGDPIRAAIAQLPEEDQREVFDEMSEIWIKAEKRMGFGIFCGLASPLTLCTAFLRVVLNDPQLTIEV